MEAHHNDIIIPKHLASPSYFSNDIGLDSPLKIENIFAKENEIMKREESTYTLNPMMPQAKELN